MKSLLLTFFLIFTLTGFSQHVLKGQITDQYSEGIPGARIYLKNSTYGVISNYNGEYFLELDSMGSFFVTYSMIGFQDSTYQITIDKNTTVFNVKLNEKPVELETVEVYADKVDIAKKVIKAASNQKKVNRKSIEAYKCNTYIKTSLEKELKPVFASKNDDIEVLGKSRMNFIESYAVTKFKQPNKYSETILAHHDYAEKSNSSVSASFSFDFGDDIVPMQYIEHNPYIFYEKVEDADFNLYQNLISLPKLSPNPIISPISDAAFLNYKFQLKAIFYEDGEKIYNIEVTPRNSEAATFSGNLFIIDESWIIKSFDLSINPSVMPLFKSFNIIQDSKEINGNWVVVRREFNYTINDFQHTILANTRVNHSNYNFDPKFDKKTFTDELLSYDPNSFDKDSSYWSDIRPIQLKQMELDFIKEQDSITKYLESEAYLDSIDRAYNKVTFWDVTLNGIGFRNRHKQQDIYIKSLLSNARVFGVGGFRYGLGGVYSKRFENGKKMRLDGDIDYGFNNKDVKGNIGVEYTYDPLKFSTVKFRVGDVYDMINNYESALGTFSRSNYVRKRFVGISHRIEITNGFFAQVGYDYSDRQEITDLQLADWSNQLFGELNEPQPFNRYIVSIFEVNLVYRFKQKYVIKKNVKQIVGSKFPELKLTYMKGVPNMFGSEVNFDFIEVSASDDVELGTFGELKWNAIAGSFVNKVDLRFIEHKFFRGSDLFFFSNPLKSHQLLDSTFHTPDPYFQAFAVHHFKGAIMNKIPLIKKLKLQLVVGASALMIQDISYSHIEFFGGIERPIKIRKQLFKIGVYSALRDNNIATSSIRLKVGLDFFNSYTNSWSY